MEAEWFTFGPESGRGNEYRFGSEAWDYGNVSNSNGCKNPGSDGETSSSKVSFEKN